MDLADVPQHSGRRLDPIVPNLVGPARRHTLDDLLRRAANRAPEKTALIGGGTLWTYAQLDRIIDQLAAGLQASGVEVGDRVALMARNSHWYVALRFAVARLGAILVPVNFMLAVDDTAYILEHSGSRLLLVDGSCAAVACEAASGMKVGIIGIPDIHHAEPQNAVVAPFSVINAERTGAPLLPAMIDGSAIAQIIYTSGTEARPKGAMLSHDALLWEYQSCIAGCDWHSDAIQINALPLFHCAQLDAFLGPAIQLGATNIILESPAPDLVLQAIGKYRATAFFAPPTVWIALLRSPLFDQSALSSLTHGFYGASIMPVQILRELMERLPAVKWYNCYGQTEIAPVATILGPEDQVRKAGSAGRAVMHVETRVVDASMRDVPPGEVGEIVHRSPQLMSGYWNDAARTEAAFAGGWFHSGDLAVMDEEGFLTIVDRKKDMIKTGGENVASREVEELLYRMPGISEVAVIGLPHPRWIEMVTAFVVPRSGHILDEASIIAHSRSVMSSFKAPKRVVIVDGLPKNASGKILKRQLREHPEALKIIAEEETGQ